MSNRILMVAYHFPPSAGSSGIQRSLKFCRYLPEFGWQPSVLSVTRGAHRVTRDDQMGEIPDDVRVFRAPCLDAARQLAIRGKYLRGYASPDRWVNWLLSGVPLGLFLIKRYKPDVIWSTYPIASAHLLAYYLHRLSGIKWVADCRDLMTEPGHPADEHEHAAFLRVEERMVKHAARVVFTTRGTLDMYAERYGEDSARRFRVITNGYDEENFEKAETLRAKKPERQEPHPIRLVHSGLLYPSERDPTAFFSALSKLKSEGTISESVMQVILRASGHDDHYRPLINRLGLSGIVRFEPGLPYTEALSELLDADVLLLFQAAHCNRQIPAKLYEYMRAARPILALTDKNGDTAAALFECGYRNVVQIDSAIDIADSIRELIIDSSMRAAPPLSNKVLQHERRATALTLARELDQLQGM